MANPERDDQALLEHLLEGKHAELAEAIRNDAELRRRMQELTAMLAALKDSRGPDAAWQVTPAQKRSLYELGATRPAGWFAALRARAAEMIAVLTPRLDAEATALAGFRAGAGSSVLTYECEELEIDLRVTPRFRLVTDRLPTDFELLGQLVGGSPATALAVAALETGALQDARLVPPDGFEAFVPPGVYEIAIALDQRVLIIPRLELLADRDAD